MRLTILLVSSWFGITFPHLVEALNYEVTAISVIADRRPCVVFSVVTENLLEVLSEGRVPDYHQGMRRSIMLNSSQNYIDMASYRTLFT
jgi:hypothetical protein